MTEGFFAPDRLAIPGLPTAALVAAMVRILPRTLLRLDIAADAESAARLNRNEDLPEGGELWHRFFTEADKARAADPEFATAMVRHEFSEAVRAGARFPLTVPLQGGGSGFAIDAHGHVLSNYHLVIAEVSHYRREAGVFGTDVPCRSVRAQIAEPDGSGGWRWRDADALWLVANPPSARALEPDATGLLHPREDTALLRVAPAPSSFLHLSGRDVADGDAVWMAGFPLRSARRSDTRQALGYDDADGSLRIAHGHVTGGDERYLEADLDGAMGNSGSPIFDASGQVVGMFSRATGNGPRNAVEYGHVTRVGVRSRLAIEGLGLGPLFAATA
ncbi:MAG: serine protease [Caldimonas sp.]